MLNAKELLDPTMIVYSQVWALFSFGSASATSALRRLDLPSNVM